MTAYHLPAGVTLREYQAQLAARVARLRAEGLTYVVISRRLGLSETAVARLARLVLGNSVTAKGRAR